MREGWQSTSNQLLLSPTSVKHFISIKLIWKTYRITIFHYVFLVSDSTQKVLLMRKHNWLFSNMCQACNHAGALPRPIWDGGSLATAPATIGGGNFWRGDRSASSWRCAGGSGKNPTCEVLKVVPVVIGFFLHTFFLWSVFFLGGVLADANMTSQVVLLSCWLRISQHFWAFIRFLSQQQWQLTCFGCAVVALLRWRVLLRNCLRRSIRRWSSRRSLPCQWPSDLGHVWSDLEKLRPFSWNPTAMDPVVSPWIQQLSNSTPCEKSNWDRWHGCIPERHGRKDWKEAFWLTRWVMARLPPPLGCCRKVVGKAKARKDTSTTQRLWFCVLRTWWGSGKMNSSSFWEMAPPNYIGPRHRNPVRIASSGS